MTQPPYGQQPPGAPAPQGQPYFQNQPYPPQPSAPQQPYPPQQAHPQQAHPQQAHPHQSGQTQLVLNLRKPFGLLSEQMITPSVRINGHPATAGWGRNVYPTHPGRHQIDCAQNYMWSFGAQSMTVDVPPGRSVEVHYTGPVVSFGAGRMGFEEQPRPGMVAFGLMIGIPVLLALLMFLAAIISAFAG